MIDVLEHKGSTKFLKYLLENKEAMLTQVKHGLRKYRIGTGALYTLLTDLLENGIITEKRVYGARLFSLTEKGRKLAEGLLRLEEELSKDP